MIENIDLGNEGITKKALDGINDLTGSKTSIELSEKIMNLFGRYFWQKKLYYEESSGNIGQDAKERMAIAGISGSAIAGINIDNNEGWAGKSDELRSEFESNLAELKKALSQTLSSQADCGDSPDF